MGADDWSSRNYVGNQAAPRNQRRVAPYSYGAGFNRVRHHASVEPAPRCARPSVAYRVICDRVRSFGNHSWLSLAQLACVRGPLAIGILLKKGGLGKIWAVCDLPSHCGTPSVFFAPKRVIAAFSNDIRINIFFRSIIVRRWNTSIPISRLVFLRAKGNPCLRGPLHEKSFHCCGCATT